MKKISETFKARRAAKLQAEDGFSLIDVVVTVAIIVALSVGGFIAYNGIVGNAQDAAVKGAADQVYTAAVTAYNSGDDDANLETAVSKVLTDYNGPVADRADKTILVNAAITNGEISVWAVDTKHDGKYAERGAAAAANTAGLDTDAPVAQ